MSKGILRIANVTGEGVDYNTRELSTETGTTLSVYLDEGRVDLARSDMGNVKAADVKQFVEDDLQKLTNDVASLNETSSGLQTQLGTKKDRLIGLLKPYASPLVAVTGTNQLTVYGFKWFDGTGELQHYEEVVTVDSSYAGQVIYVGLNSSGVAEISTSDWDLYCVLANIYVNADGDLTATELSVRPYLAESSNLGREHPVMVNGFEVSINSNKTLSHSAFTLIKEGISHTNIMHPDARKLPLMNPANFKYYYPNYDHDKEPISSTVSAVFYNTTTGAKQALDTSLGTSKFVVYRLAVVETGQMLLLCQQAASVDDLFSSKEDVATGIDSLQWNLTGLSSRVIYLDVFLMCSADASIIEQVKQVAVSNSQYVTVNAGIVGVLEANQNMPYTTQAFEEIFGTTPTKMMTVLKRYDNQDYDWAVNVVNSITGSSVAYYIPFVSLSKEYIGAQIQENSPIYGNKIAKYTGYFPAQRTNETFEVAAGTIKTEDDASFGIMASIGYLVYDAHGALAVIIDSEGEVGSLSRVLTGKIIKSVNETGTQFINMTQLSSGSTAPLIMTTNRTMYNIVVSTPNASGDSLMSIRLNRLSDLVAKEQYTFEVLLDLKQHAAIASTQFTGVKFLDSSGDNLTVTWLDNSGGLFSTSLEEADVHLIVVRKTYVYDEDTSTFKEVWLANFQGSVNKQVLFGTISFN